MSDLKKEIERIERKAKSFHEFLKQTESKLNAAQSLCARGKNYNASGHIASQKELLKDIYVVFMATFGKYLPEEK